MSDLNFEDRHEEARAVYELALKERIPLSRAARRFASGDEARRLYRRVKRYIRNTPNGEEAVETFLLSGSWYDIMVGSQIASRPSDVTRVLAFSSMPISEACDGLKNKQRVYQALYNRILRQYPAALDQKARNDTRSAPSVFSIEPGEVESSASS